MEWGQTEALGQSTSGTALTTSGSARVHEVLLDGLDPDTRYYYRVITESLSSEVYTLRTPPDPAAEASTRLVAMSDMQKARCALRCGRTMDPISRLPGRPFSTTFRDDSGQELGSSEVLTDTPTSWTQMESQSTLPVGTRVVQVSLSGSRSSGTDNDSYLDSVRFQVGSPGTDDGVDCQQWSEPSDTGEPPAEEEDTAADSGGSGSDGSGEDPAEELTADTGCGCQSTARRAAILWGWSVCFIVMMRRRG